MGNFDDLKSYLETSDWLVSEARSSSDFVSATRAGVFGSTDAVSVWCPKIDVESWRRSEGAFLQRFDREGASGQRILLVESREGLSADFQRAALRDHNVQIRTPIQFFDASFKWDGQSGDGRAATAAAELRRQGELVTKVRTPQPFENVTTGEHGPDLLKTLVQKFALSSEWSHPIVLVTAPAGFGKSTLFSSLYASLYTDFQRDKREQRRARRPLPLLPEYAEAASGTTLKGLVEAFIRSDVASPIGLPTFEWMLTNGYGTWLLDGLDELIVRDRGFFEYVEDILTRDHQIAPRILICVRDSLLSASPSLRDFISASEGVVEQFRLEPWDDASLSTFAKLRLLSQAEAFLSSVENPSVRKLIRTPYYADLVADRFHELGKIESDWGEFDLLESALEAMVRREYEKNLLDESIVSVEDVIDVIQDVAQTEFESSGRGIAVEEISELADLVIPFDLPDEDRERVQAQFHQLSVFQRSTERGRVRFAQDVIFEYLVGRLAAHYFRSNPGRLIDLLGHRRLPPDSIALRALRREIISRGAYNDVEVRAANAVGNANAFVNLLQTIIELPAASDILPDLTLERQDLSGVRFQGLKLSGVSFRGANLEESSFESCNLAGAIFADAVLHNTIIIGSRKSMPQAEFGTLAGFVSVVLEGNQTIDDVNDFLRIIGGPSRENAPALSPCPSAAQLRFILLKFVRPDGQARRDWLGEKGILAGRHFTDPGTVLRSAVRQGLLVRPRDGRDRYERPRGDIYAELVSFATALQVGPNVRTVLEDVCSRKGCLHLAEVH